MEKKFRTERPEEYRAMRRKKYLPATAKKARLKRIAWLKAGTVTKQDLQNIYSLYGGKCAYCGIDVKPRYTTTDPRGFDHVKSRTQGGKHEKGNIVVCCRKCNEIKG
jgi:5-methylcytosine-specific restriction endonuclease McrA